MRRFGKNAVVGQSGGPTAAINATLAGVIQATKKHNNNDKLGILYGMKNGIEGLLREDLINLSECFEDDKDIKTLSVTPAAALGSCRKKLKTYEEDAETYSKIINILEKYEIGYFFYIGGNDSMDTVYKLSEYASSVGVELSVIGIPKTVDNDLAGTDHTPGFGSAAKFVATTVKEILRDVSVYTVKAVTIVEIMGRDAGWLTSAAALPIASGGLAPDLIYLPETVFDTEGFVLSVKKKLEEHPAVLVAVSEGIRLADGRYVGEGIDGGKVDAFGHKQLSGAGKTLELLLKDRLGCKVRSIELNLPQRCAGHILSKTDIDESLLIGEKAVDFALIKKTGVMVTVSRIEGEEYSIQLGCEDITKIANAVRGVPREYINSEGNGVTEACIEYLLPLIIGEINIEYENGMPKHFIF